MDSLKQKYDSLELLYIKALIRMPSGAEIAKTSKVKDYVIHYNEELKFKVGFPKQWSSIKNFSENVVLLANNPENSFSLNIFVLPTENNLESVHNSGINGMKRQFPDTKVLTDSMFILNKNQSYFTEMKYTEIVRSNEKMQSISIQIVKHKKQYLFTYSAKQSEFEKYRKTITNLIQFIEVY